MVVAAVVDAALLDEPGALVAVVLDAAEDSGLAAFAPPSHAVRPAPTATDADQVRKFRRDIDIIRPPQIRG
jgi:hypothetical protein